MRQMLLDNMATNMELSYTVLQMLMKIQKALKVTDADGNELSMEQIEANTNALIVKNKQIVEWELSNDIFRTGTLN